MNIVKEKDCFLNISQVNHFNYGKFCSNWPKGPSFGAFSTYGTMNTINLPMDMFIKTQNSPAIRTGAFSKAPKIKKPANKRFEIEDYCSLGKCEKDYMMANMPDGIKALAAVNIGIGSAIKKEFDEKYGEGGYKFISLGTSPALAAKVMELEGADVVYLPMSYSHSTCTKSWLEKSPYIDFYKSYMEKNGLSNEALQKEGKKGIICDYTITGRSLELSEFMLKGPLGLDESLLDTYTMNELIKNSSYIPNEFKDRYLDELLKKERAADYCNVPHFSFIDKKPFNSGKITDAKSLENYFDNYRSSSSNAFNFSVMKLLEERGELKTGQN